MSAKKGWYPITSQICHVYLFFDKILADLRLGITVRVIYAKILVWQLVFKHVITLESECVDMCLDISTEAQTLY